MDNREILKEIEVEGEYGLKVPYLRDAAEFSAHASWPIAEAVFPSGLDI